MNREAWEFLSMVHWLRSVNRERPRVVLSGFDMQSVGRAMSLTESFLEHHDPDFLISAREIYASLEGPLHEIDGVGASEALADAPVGAGERAPLEASVPPAVRVARRVLEHVESHQDRYVAIGFTTTAGDYRAVDGDGAPISGLPLAAPPADSYEATFSASQLAGFVLDLRPLRDPGDGESASRPLRVLASHRRDGDRQFVATDLAEDFDLIVHVERRTSTRSVR